MVVVVKIGGSLSETPEILAKLGNYLSQKSSEFHFVVIPGGGRFADVVRELDAKFSLKPMLSHKMAILGMNQFGLMLSHLIPNSEVTESLENAKEISKNNRVRILLPYRPMLLEDPFIPSWDATSDSIAAYFASKLGENRVFLFTDVDGVYDQDPKKSPDARLLSSVSASELSKRAHRTSVDKSLANTLIENHIDCYVINGRFPQRLGKILSGLHNVKCTQIKS